MLTTSSPSNKRKQYLVVFAHIFQEFRLPELLSVCQLVSPAPLQSYLHVLTPSQSYYHRYGFIMKLER